MLSRALKVHVNAAKQMLYDFHQTQNARRPSSVHATYLLSGVRMPIALASVTNGSHKDGDDMPMADASGPGAMSSSMPEHEEQVAEIVPVTTITLVAEAALESVKAQYESISSIQICALTPGPLKDMQVLSECNRRLAIDYAGEDSLETWKTYGTIHNPNAQRRATRIPPPGPAPAANVTAGMKSATTGPAKSTAAATASQSSSTSGKAASAEAPSQAASSSSTTTKKPPTAKREPSNLMASFGKTAASNAKLKLNTPADGGDDAEDEAMEDPPAAPEETAEQRARAEAARKEKADKEAKLRAMMEGDDEEQEEKDDADEEMKEAWSESEHEAEPEPAPEPEPEAPAATPAEQGVTTTGGRRRGRRRVMKKKTTKDAEGYLVTKEEAAWESFSEDEAPRPAKVEVNTPAATANKVKDETPAAKKSSGGAASGAAKKGQGNIMSFFKK